MTQSSWRRPSLAWPTSSSFCGEQCSKICTKYTRKLHNLLFECTVFLLRITSMLKTSIKFKIIVWQHAFILLAGYIRPCWVPTIENISTVLLQRALLSSLERSRDMINYLISCSQHLKLVQMKQQVWADYCSRVSRVSINSFTLLWKRYIIEAHNNLT